MSASPTRLIKLSGKYATGKHRFAVVDADCFDELSRYRWKAKPNRSGARVYGVRNVIEDGRLITLRLNRVVLGIAHGSPGDVRFLNGDSLDCRRANLEHCTRSETTSAARVVRQHARCKACGNRFAFWKPRYAREGFCSDVCRAVQTAKQKLEAKARLPRVALITKLCDQCDQRFTQVKPWQRFCGASCKAKAKYQRRIAKGTPRGKNSEG